MLDSHGLRLKLAARVAARNRRLRRWCWHACGFGLLQGVPAATISVRADAAVPFNIEAHGLIDLRYAHVQGRQSWLDDDLGRFRLGGGDPGRDYLRLNETALTLRTRADWLWSATLTLKHAAGQHQALDLTEAFLHFRPAPVRGFGFALRGGYFFPPISLENTGTAWSSPYTLTSSAINTWVGEELRVFGAEAQLSYATPVGDRLSVFGAGFANNDTAGTLLAYRGWSLHDYEATLSDRLPLPLRTGLQRALPLQAGRTAPFVEVDGRAGYYAGLALERPRSLKLRGLYYDNSARPTALQQGQYAWHTRFWSAGLQVGLPNDLTLIAQWLQGRTQMGENIDGRFVADAGFWSYSVLLSKAWAGQRLSLRADRFGTDEADHLPEQPNRESGLAWTLNHNVTLARRHQISAEVTYIDSRRAEPPLPATLQPRTEVLWQLGYRLFF